MSQNGHAHKPGSSSGDTAGNSAGPGYWQMSQTYLKFASAFLLTGALALMLAVRVVTPEETLRYAAPSLALLIATATLMLAWRGKIQAAAFVLAAGAWVTVTAAAVWFGGVRSVALYPYPVIIILIGWLIGTRAALWMAGLTVVTILGLLLADNLGALPSHPRTPVIIFGIVQILIVALATAMIVYLARAYQHRLAELSELSSSLAQRTTELEARSAELQRAQTVAKVGNWLVDLAGGGIRLSAETCRIFGVPDGTPGNREALLTLVHPDDRATVDRAWQAVLEGIALNHEYRIVTRGTTLWIVQSTEVECASDGTPLRAFGTVQDITLRKHAEAALQESEARYRTLAEWSPEPISVHRDGTIIYANPASVRLLGASSAAQLVGQTVFSFLHPDSHDIAKARAKEVIALGRNEAPAQLKLVKFDGSVIDVESQGVKIIFDGQPAVHSSQRDVTAQKAAEAARASLEAQLRESQKMQAIGTLAGGIAHDFNNIIATILGNAELARQDARANAPVLESLEEIRKSGSRARDLVQQILSFSRREPTRRSLMALTPVIEDAVRLLRATLPARVALDVWCESAVPAVLADKTQIEQVLINLATNAMQAMRDAPGRIDIRLDCAAVNAAMKVAHPALRDLRLNHLGQAVRLTVSDNGPGMDSATLPRIFEPFFTTKQVGEGTGLGLSVVHGIVQAHEGAIVVESTPGKGSTFTIYLPPAAEAATSTAPASDLRGAASGSAQPGSTPVDSTPSGRSPSGISTPVSSPLVSSPLVSSTPVSTSRQVLYIDDDAALVFLVKRLLERRGIRVVAHTSQHAALDALRADPAAFDLVLTDYNMPEMSGLDVARAVRGISASIPVVVTSGFIDEQLRAQAAGAGVRELLFKASAVEEFCGAIEALL